MFINPKNSSYVRITSIFINLFWLLAEIGSKCHNLEKYFQSQKMRSKGKESKGSNMKVVPVPHTHLNSTHATQHSRYPPLPL